MYKKARIENIYDTKILFMTIVTDIILTHAYPLMAVSSSFMASIFRFQLHI